jgi:hypothetical protein
MKGWQNSADARHMGALIGKNVDWENGKYYSYIGLGGSEPREIDYGVFYPDSNIPVRALAEFIKKHLVGFSNRIFISISPDDEVTSERREEFLSDPKELSLSPILYNTAVFYLILPDSFNQDLVESIITRNTWFSYVSFIVTLIDGATIDADFECLVQLIEDVNMVITDAYDLDGFAVWEHN